MAKVALLIGVSEYEPGLHPLPRAARNIQAMQRVLQHPEKGNFDQVETLLNPDLPTMQDAIKSVLGSCTPEDVVLFFFSGHGIRGDRGRLHFATRNTGKSLTGESMAVAAVPASFVRDVLDASRCQHQVVILDCYLDAPIGQSSPLASENRLYVDTQLGGKGRAILASFSTIEGFSLREESASVYTRYLVEGIETGAADRDEDGWIAVDELHEYAARKVREAAPALTPEFYGTREGHKIILAKSPTHDPKLKYRKEAERRICRGEISEVSRYILDNLAWGLQLTSQERAAIEAEIQKPHREYREKLQRYEQAYEKALRRHSPIDTQSREDLSCVQQFLGLRDIDIVPIQEAIAAKITEDSQRAEVEPIPTQVGEAVIPRDEPDEEIPNPLGSDSGEDSLPSLFGERLPGQTPALATPSPRPNSASSPEAVPAKHPAVSTASSRLPIAIGIGSGLAMLAIAIGLFTRLPVTPSPESDETEPPTPQAQDSRQGDASQPAASPRPTNPTTLPEDKRCQVVVSGNIRSEQTTFRDNIVRSNFRVQLSATGKQTRGGWIEVELPNGELGWTHRNVILDDEDLDSCLFEKDITLELVPDIPPPEPEPSD